MILTDTHTHLYAEEFDTDRAQVIKKALQLGVQHFYLPNVDSSTIAPMLELEKDFPENCFPMMGLHPCSVKANYQEELAIVESWLHKRKFVAIGEIGMDLYWDKTFIEEQRISFLKQIQLSTEFNLPIIIHCRDAFDEIVALLKTCKEMPRGIFHCFSGNLDQAKQILAFGTFKLGIGGVITFKNSGLDKVVEQLDLEDVVLETDSPYLAPVPHRGKRNESAYLFNVAKKIAEIKQTSIEEIARITTQNAASIFGETTKKN